MRVGGREEDDGISFVLLFFLLFFLSPTPYRGQSDVTLHATNK